jgi:hypothetical protein
VTGSAQQAALPRHGLFMENSSQQLIQVIQVILTLLPQRFLATIKVVQFSAVAGQAVRRGLAQPNSGLPESSSRGAGRCARSSFRWGGAMHVASRGNVLR